MISWTVLYLACFVHYRKPDEDIYRIALDLSQTSPDRVVYIDDRALFVEVAKGLGINGIHHMGYESTREIGRVWIVP